MLLRFKNIGLEYVIGFDKKIGPNSKWPLYLGKFPKMSFAPQPGSRNSNSQPPLQLEHRNVTQLYQSHTQGGLQFGSAGHEAWWGAPTFHWTDGYKQLHFSKWSKSMYTVAEMVGHPPIFILWFLSLVYVYLEWRICFPASFAARYVPMFWPMGAEQKCHRNCP